MKEYLKQLKQFLAILTHHPLYIRYSLVVIPAVSAFLAILIVAFITVPQILKLIENNQKLQETRQKISLRQEKIRTLDNLDLEVYKTGLNNVLYTLPGDREIPSAINSILEVLSSSGLRLENFSLGAAVTGTEGVEGFVVKIDVSGNLDQIKNTINLAAESSRLLRINGISITNSSFESAQTSFDIVVFYARLDPNTKIDPNQKISGLSDEEQKLLSQITEKIQSVKVDEETITTDSPTGKPNPFN